MYLLILPVAYIIGGINFGVIISKLFFGKDVRNEGSGNAGATNMLRSFGKAAAAAVFIGDVLKGSAVVLLAKYIIGDQENLYPVVLAAGFLTVVGHIFPIFFKFKGGKGVATVFGVVLALEPLTALILFAVFLAIAIMTKYISLGSIISAALIPAGLSVADVISKNHVLPDLCFGILCAAMIIFMHRENIKRLINGEERKITKK